MDKYANQLYINKIIFNQDVPIRAQVKRILEHIRPYFTQNNQYLDYLRALMFSESIGTKDHNNFFIRQYLLSIPKMYRKDIGYVIGKARAFMMPLYYMEFTKSLPLIK